MIFNVPIYGGVKSNVRNTVILSSIIQPALYPFLDYVPFYGFDISYGNDIAVNLPILGCDLVCKKTATCIAFVTSHEYCYLKSVFINPYLNSDEITYFQVQPRRDYTVFQLIGVNVDVIISYSGHLTECRQACDSVPTCTGYVTFIKVIVNDF